MSFSTARKAVDFLLANEPGSSDRKAICFYGGEPLLQWQLIERIMDYASANSSSALSYHLTTNGLMLRSRDVREMLRRYRVHVMVSIDGPAYIHDLFRRRRDGGPTHALIEEALNAMLDEDSDYVRDCILVNAVVALPSRLMEAAAYFRDSPLYASAKGDLVRYNGVDTFGDQSLRVELNSMANSLPAQTQVLSPREAFVSGRVHSVAPADRLETLFRMQLVRIAHRRIEPISELLTPTGFCVPGTRKLFVSVDGRFDMCEKAAGAFPIGDVGTGIDIDLVMDVLQRMHALWSEDCSRCVAQRFCGSCPVSVSDGSGQLDSAAFKRECAMTVTRFQQSLEDFVRICDANPAYLAELEAVVVE
jgi:uncharacterized protein